MRARLTLTAVGAALAIASPAAAEIPSGNLLLNSGAEAAAGAVGTGIQVVPDWNVQSNFTVVQYDTPDFLTNAQSLAWGGGWNFFGGGPSTAASSAAQAVDVSMAAPEIDAGGVTMKLGALLGGNTNQGDQAMVTATPMDATGAALGTTTLPPVTPADRADDTTLLSRTTAMPLPAGTRSVLVELLTQRMEGDYDDGYIDNVRLSLVPTQLPQPVYDKSVNVEALSGTILLRSPDNQGYVQITTGISNIPLGSTVDARHGQVELSSVPAEGAQPESAQFTGGIFVVKQLNGITTLTLSQGLAGCGAARAAQSEPNARRLWGEGSGHFRIRGRYSYATARGTARWLVRDSCLHTTTRVTQGAAVVRDKVRKKTVLVRADGRYIARPKRR
jgi:hypothetical protein